MGGVKEGWGMHLAKTEIASPISAVCSKWIHTLSHNFHATVPNVRTSSQSPIPILRTETEPSKIDPRTQLSC